MHFKTIIFLIVIATFFGSCNQNKILKLDGDVLEATGYYENGLPYDGCDRHFNFIMLDSTYASYTPSDASDRLINKVLGEQEILLSPVHVRVRYQPTGAKRKVQCGWGQTALFEEINVLKIEKI